MVFCDTHTHIYSDEFSEDTREMMQRALDRGVRHLFLPAIDSEWHARMLGMAGDFPGMCYPMMGLHPTSVKGNFRDELALVERYLANPDHRFFAVGEVGIDLYWDKTFAAEQQEAFIFQAELALRYDLPLVIHTRNSMDLALEILSGMKQPGLRGVFHCFSGNTAQAVQAVGLGFMLGIGGVVTYKNSGLQAVVESIGLENLLLETDAPWLTPAPHRGKRNEPSYIPLIAARIAELKNRPVEEVARVTTGNAGRIFGVDLATK